MGDAPRQLYIEVHNRQGHSSLLRTSCLCLFGSPVSAGLEKSLFSRTTGSDMAAGLKLRRTVPWQADFGTVVPCVVVADVQSTWKRQCLVLLFPS